MTANEDEAKKNSSQRNLKSKNIQFILPSSTDLQALLGKLFQSPSSSSPTSPASQQMYTSQSIANIDTNPGIFPNTKTVFFNNERSVSSDNIAEVHEIDNVTNISCHQIVGYSTVPKSKNQQPDLHHGLPSGNNIPVSGANLNILNATPNTCTNVASTPNKHSIAQYENMKNKFSNTTMKSFQEVGTHVQSGSSGDTTHKIYVTLENHPNTLLNKLENFKKQQRFCDLTIKIGDVKFNCHSVVVAAMSTVINELLLTKSSRIESVLITLPSVLNVKYFSELLNAMYTGQMELRKENVKEMLQICSYLKISSIQTQCELYYKTIFGDCSTDELTQMYTDVNKMAPPQFHSRKVEVDDENNVQKDSLELDSEIVCDGDNNMTQNGHPIIESPCLDIESQTKPRSSLTNLVRVASEAFKDLDQENQVSLEGEIEEIESECSQSTNDDTDDATSDEKIKGNNWCNKCKKQFTSSKRFSNHIKLAHSGNRHKCSFCAKTFKKCSDKSLHERRVHTKEKPLKCKICVKRFCLKRELNHHMKMHEGEDQSCPICKKIFRSEDGLKHHIAAHGEKKYVCRNSTCQKAFPTIMLRNRHEKSHSTVKPFSCDKCDYSFKLNHELVRHKLKHTGEKQFKCEKCSRSFGRAEHLKGHMLSHSDVRNFKCDVCNKTFKQKSGLSVHKLKHDAPFNYVCDVCGYKCHSKSNLQLHSVTHVNERPFQCNICLALFKAKKYLNRHSKIHERKGETTAEKYTEMKNVKKLSNFDDITKLKNSQVIYPKPLHTEKSQKKILPKVSNVLSKQKLVQPSSYYACQPMFQPSPTVLPSLQEAFRVGTSTNLTMGQEQGVTTQLVRMPQSIQVNEDLLQFSNNVVIGQVIQSGIEYSKNTIGDTNNKNMRNWQCQAQTTAVRSSLQPSHENLGPVLSADHFLQ